MKKPIIAGNWKMNKTLTEAISLARELKGKVGGVEDVDVVICPPFIALDAVSKLIAGTSIMLGGQNMYKEEKGAYTGEISPAMLKSVGCDFVIIGHSERREYFQETDALINEKIKLALQNQLSPILCVGEKLEERESGRTKEVVEREIREGLKGLDRGDLDRVIIAYEPIWAIGTGRTATPEEADRIHKYIRTILAEIYDEELARTIRIQYGGSVNPSNIDVLMSRPNIDGALVGGASLNADSFARIVGFKKQN